MTKNQSRLVRVGEYVVDVQVELTENESSWSPLLSLKDARKLDHVRKALVEDRLKGAAQFGRVYKMTPLAV